MYFGHYHRDVFVSKIFDHGKIWPSSMLVNALSLEFHWMRRLASRLHHRPGCEQWHWHQGVLLEKRIKLVLKGPKFRILYLKSWIAVLCFQATYNLLYLFAWRPFIVLRVCVSIRHVCKWWGLRASSTACTGGVSRGGQAAVIGAHNMSLFRFFLVGSRHRNLCSIFVEQNTTFVHSEGWDWDKRLMQACAYWQVEVTNLKDTLDKHWDRENIL